VWVNKKAEIVTVHHGRGTRQLHIPLCDWCILIFFLSAVCLSVVVVDTETMIECNEQRMLQADLRLLLNAAVIKTLAHHLPLQLL